MRPGLTTSDAVVQGICHKPASYLYVCQSFKSVFRQLRQAPTELIQNTWLENSNDNNQDNGNDNEDNNSNDDDNNDSNNNNNDNGNNIRKEKKGKNRNVINIF